MANNSVTRNKSVDSFLEHLVSIDDRKSLIVLENHGIKVIQFCVMQDH